MAGLPPLKNAAYTFEIALTSQGDTDIFQVNPTLAAGDVTVSRDGGAFANIGTLPVAIGGGAVVTATLAAGETADRVAVLFHDAAGDEWQDLLVFIEFETLQINDLSTFDFTAVLDGTITIEQALNIMLAALAGKSTGGGTTTVTFRDVGDTKARITATVDAQGNRTSVTVDGT